MRNQDQWQPSKYILDSGHLKATRDRKIVAVGSRILADRIATFYETYIPKHVHGNLLDLGCGKAPLYVLYQNYSTSVTCVDWQQSLHDQSYLDFNCDLNAPLPFDNKVYDTIIFSDVLEHVHNPHQLFSEMARVLRPGGKLVMNVPFFYWLHEIPHDYYRYTEYALKHFAQKSGFNVLNLEILGGAPEIVLDILCKNIRRMKPLGREIASAIEIVGMPLLKSYLGQKISRATAQNFPYAYGMVLVKS